MKYSLRVLLTENDYYEFNVFHATRSHYGKKTLAAMRNMFFILSAAIAVLVLVLGDFTIDSIISAVIYALVPIVLSFFVKPIMRFSLKGTIAALKKSGKLGYSPESVIEFYDETFKEITPDEMSEKKYSTIERVSIIEGSTVYLHTNASMCLILPRPAFESDEEYTSFIDFIKSKCDTIDYYENK